MINRKKFIASFLAFSLMAINCATLKRLEDKREKREKKGAELIIQKINGQQVSGELITVKPNTLLLLDTEGKDVSVDIADIKVIRIVKKSKALLGAGIGGFIGVVAGALLLLASEEADVGILPIAVFSSHGVQGGVIGVIIGGIAGDMAGRDKTIQIEGMSDLEIQEALEKLRKKARIRDYK